MKNLLRQAVTDIPAGLVVFLVALPLCLGIALGSGAPLFSGIIAGMVGGLVVGALSGSSLSVSGPAAGLTVIVAAAITATGSWEAFVLAVVLAGLLQIGAGTLKLGTIGDYIPNSVIKGMLAAIGLLLILKQAPHLVGYDADFEGDESFLESTQHNTFSTLLYATRLVRPAAVVVGAGSLLILWLWERPFLKRRRWLKLVPGPLVAVVVGVALNELIFANRPELRLDAEHMVSLPVTGSTREFFRLMHFPNLAALTQVAVWKAGATIAVVASLETLLGLAAVDKLDPLNRVSPPNRELVAQGVGNVVSGLLGGLPLTSVIVRSAANVNAGAGSRLSTIVHGILILLSAMFFAGRLNSIPLAALASILIFTGYKLVKVQLFREHYAKGWDQFIPFVVTIAAVLLTDLLVGIAIGLAVGIAFLLHSNFRSSLLLVSDGNNYLLRLRKDVSFFTKPLLRRRLEELPADSSLLVDLTRADFVDRDVIDVLNEFGRHATLKNIRVFLKKGPLKPSHAALRLELSPEPTSITGGTS